MSASGLVSVIGFAALGLALGFAFFVSLRINVGLYLGGGGWTAPLGLHLVRITVAAVAFWLAARQGAVPLVAMLAGFVAARPLAGRSVRS